MSRSKRKTKAIKITGKRKSDKKNKRIANRIFRRKESTALKNGSENNIPVSTREVSDTWDFVSDGKAVYSSNLSEKYMRK